MRQDKIFIKLRKNQTVFPVEHLHENLLSLEFSGEGVEELPEAIGHCHKLETLVITALNVEWLPKSIAQLPALKILKIKANISHLFEIPPDWSNLQTLQINHSSLKNIPHWIKNFSQLETLNLSHNKLMQAPPEIIQLPNLRRLNLEHNQIKTFPFDPQQLIALNHLSLDDNPISDDEKARIERTFGIWF